MSSTIAQIKQEMSKVVVGQESMIDGLLIGMLTGGHVLLEGVPGLAKTTTVNTLAKAFSLNFKRVQFTPDLLPSDIIGAEVYDPAKNEFRIKQGPIFTNILLADEINRAPAKVQSALLEVMAERQATIGDQTFKIDKPFLVLATQNPVEQEGVYSLPEAQLDRFMLKITVGYNTQSEELEIARRVANDSFGDVSAIATVEDIASMREAVKNVHIDEELEQYIIELIFATRKDQEFLQYGASPRASIDLFRAAKAIAYMNGKDFVSPSDIAKASKNVLRHRLILSYEGEAEGKNVDDIITTVLSEVPIP
jgi:MoxR-like ATPase